jgi:hypothetical protein
MVEAVAKLAGIRERFEQGYRAMLDSVLAWNLPTAVCTIYDGRFPDPGRQRLVVTALAIFNDVITRAAFARGVALIDLRLICDADEDYANPIEPSVRGGEKIAAAIVGLAVGQDAPGRRLMVVAR